MFTEEIESKMKRHNEIILYGIGGTANKFLTQFKSDNIKYICKGNSTYEEEYYKGIKVISISQLKNMDKNALVIILSIYYREIETLLEDMGFKKVIKIIDYDIFFNKHYSIENILCNKEKIDIVYDLFNDCKSKDVFRSLISARMLGDTRILGSICDEEERMYFEPDIIRMSENEVFANAGEVYGETTKQFLQTINNKYKKILIFEPNKVNVERIKENLNGLSNIEVISKGLYNQNDILGFSMDGAASKIENYSEEKIIVESLDNYYNEEITFIKLDIEGAELRALEGAKKIIKNNKPKLAIALYHLYDDLWEIPLFIKNIEPEYKLYIRHYGDKLYETILYAVVE